jgi:hypothetical protein
VRRIGLGPAGTPVPILGGARLSGKVRDYDVGFLQMRTERQGATPANNYTVGRLRRNLLRSSWIGVLVTSRDAGVSGDYNRVYGADAHFQLYDRLELDGYLLQSATPGRSGRSQAHRFQTMWRDEELTINGEYNTVQPNFNPELGFVRRQDMVQYLGQVSWEPQLVESPTIRTLNFGTSLDYYEGSASGRLETRVQEGTAGISFDSGGSMTFAAEQTFDRFVHPLTIPAGTPRATIPAGDHEFLSYAARFSTSAQRMLSGNGSIGWHG